MALFYIVWCVSETTLNTCMWIKSTDTKTPHIANHLLSCIIQLLVSSLFRRTDCHSKLCRHCLKQWIVAVKFETLYKRHSIKFKGVRCKYYQHEWPIRHMRKVKKRPWHFCLRVWCVTSIFYFILLKVHAVEIPPADCWHITCVDASLFLYTPTKIISSLFFVDATLS